MTTPDTHIHDAPIANDTAAHDAFTLAYLQERQAPCPSCGYNVHQLSQARCPECGVPLRAQVVSTDTIDTWWLIALLTSAISSGFGLLGLLFFPLYGWPHSTDVLFHAAWAFYLFMVPTTLLLLLIRRWFSRWPTPIRVLIALCLSLLLVLSFFSKALA